MNRQQRRRHERLVAKQQSRDASSAGPSASRRPKRGSSRSGDQPGADYSTLEHHDGYATARNALRHIAREQGHWAGIPMPIEGQPLTIEPRYPRAAELELIGQKPTSADEALPHGLKMRNAWWSRRRGCEVFVWSEPDGSVKWGLVPAFHAMSHALKTLGASDAWGLEQESKALNLLATLVRHRQFKQYLLTGSFLETSQRSGVTYMFRKLRPTVAMAARASQTTSYEVGETEARHDAGGSSRILAALCMHSIGYYQDSWAGAMCPTDDVIAHLVLMRGDEPMFWRRCNQHPPYKPQAGL